MPNLQHSHRNDGWGIVHDPWRPPGTKLPDPRGVRKFRCLGTYPVGNTTVWQLQFYSVGEAAEFNRHRWYFWAKKAKEWKDEND